MKACKVGENMSPEAMVNSSKTIRYQLEFTGTAREYFRIWIVNTFLTILTLGIYAAWAKVRTRQYFYTHTRLAGQPFEYLADPIAILRGNLIVGGGFILYIVLSRFNTTAGMIIIGIFLLLFPFLIYKTLRFYAHNSSFRNIKFRFLGKLGQSYSIYLLFPLMIVATEAVLFYSIRRFTFLSIMNFNCLFIFWLYISYWFLLHKQYFFKNFAFGITESSFDGMARFFYKTCAFAILRFIIPLAAIFASRVIIFRLFLPEDDLHYFFILTSSIFYSWIFIPSVYIFGTIIRQYLYASIANYCWQNTRIGFISFESTINSRKFIGIQIVNILAIIISFGLLIPWAKVRRTRYILENLTIITHGSLDEFIGATTSEHNAIGDVATDFFNIDISL